MPLARGGAFRAGRAAAPRHQPRPAGGRAGGRPHPMGRGAARGPRCAAAVSSRQPPARGATGWRQAARGARLLHSGTQRVLPGLPPRPHVLSISTLLAPTESGMAAQRVGDGGCTEARGAAARGGAACIGRHGAKGQGRGEGGREAHQGRRRMWQQSAKGPKSGGGQVDRTQPLMGRPHRRRGRGRRRRAGTGGCWPARGRGHRGARAPCGRCLAARRGLASKGGSCNGV
jgi:hypothetical protein